MTKVNGNFLKLQSNYLFVDIARKVAAFKEKHPEKRVISLGIGDVTQPLVPAVISALHAAVDEMAQSSTFHGYGPEQGYAFLREAIAQHDYQKRNIAIKADDIFISDGAKSDLGNFQEIFDSEAIVAVTDPVYPVYVDSNVMAGRAGTFEDARWQRIIYLPCTKENAFVPELPKTKPDLIYLCYPNNPTGTVLPKEALKTWVDYALREHCVILYDSAYEAYIQDANVCHSIYEIPGAEQVAVEFRSFSKTAGFTGLRCAYTVVPESLQVQDGKGGNVQLKAIWNRRQCTKYNGCPYIVQKAAASVYTQEGQQQIKNVINIYHNNAKSLAQALQAMGLEVYGGVNAPYIWVHVPQKSTSWDFFHQLLEQAALICTPGVGFGKSGEGYVRLTAFGSKEDTAEAIERMRKL
ncbi:MAG: LL-diaminopimelate aminotransferase [Desulfovibrionaceae bacterium]|nr:LL-diaminopimelate aminotransferase [Desulfovibrionaceae bacterium]